MTNTVFIIQGLLLVLLIVIQSCAAPLAPDVDSNADSLSFPVQLDQGRFAMTSSPVTIEATDSDQWLIQVEQSLAEDSAAGRVVIRSAAPPDPDNPPHLVLASSRAWLALGDQFIDQGNFEAAIACAKQGLAVLGSEYAGSEVEDDTEMKLLAAEDRIQAGHLQDGASVMLRMLKTRTELYQELHAATVVQ